MDRTTLEKEIWKMASEGNSEEIKTLLNHPLAKLIQDYSTYGLMEARVLALCSGHNNVVEVIDDYVSRRASKCAT
jgi:hypothetical protein